MKRWRLSVFVRTPLFQEVEEASAVGGLPKFLGRAFPAIFQPHRMKLSEGEFVVSPFVESIWDVAARPGMPMVIMTEVELPVGKEPLDVLTQIEPSLEEVLDRLSFAWMYPVTAFQAEIAEVTPPLAAGQTRDVILLPGYSTPKFRMHVYDLRPEIAAVDSVDAELTEPTKAALRWYGVASAPQPDVQRFMALWIAFEILVKATEDAVKRPYKAPCGHEIGTCPVCATATTRAVGGEQMIAFLVNKVGIDEGAAKALWRTRQMMHGANRLTPKHLAQLPQDISVLWPAVRRTIASAVGMNVGTQAAAAMMFGFTWIMGTRELGERDLEPLKPTFEPPTNPLFRVEML